MWREAAARTRNSDTAKARDLLKKAHDAAALGLSLIVKERQKAVATAEKASQFSEKIAASHTIRC